MNCKILIILFYSCFLFGNVVEPISSKRALFILPFQDDFKKDYIELLSSLHKNYDIDVISDVDIEFSIDDEVVIYERTTFSSETLDNYFSKLSDYDLIYFDSHGGKNTMATGVPAPKTNIICNENNSDSLECKKHLAFLSDGYKLSWLKSERKDFTVKSDLFEDKKERVLTYSITADFFKNRFKDLKKFRNTVFFAENCHNAEGLFPDTLTNKNVGVGLFLSWDGTLTGSYTKKTTIPFLKKLTEGMTVSESLNGLEISFERPTKVDETFFGLIDYVSETEPLNFSVKKSESVENNDLHLFNKKQNFYLIGDTSFLNNDILTNENKVFIQGIVNSIYGLASKSNRIKFYLGHKSLYTIKDFNSKFKDIIDYFETRGFIVEITDEESLQLEGYRSVFVIAPGADKISLFNSLEINKILSYINSGGSFSLLIDSDDTVNDYTTVNNLLNDLGIEIGINNILNTNSLRYKINDNLINHITYKNEIKFNNYVTFEKNEKLKGDLIISDGESPIVLRLDVDTSNLIDESIFDLSSRTVSISIIDSNSVQDEYFDLYVNNKFIGKVENPPGKTTFFEDINLNKGENLIELRVTDKEISDTLLIIKFYPDELEKVFSGNDINYTWKVIAP